MSCPWSCGARGPASAVSRKEADALQVTKAEAEAKAAEQRKALEGLVTSERKQVAAARLQNEEANKRETELRRKVSALEVAQGEAARS